MKKIIFVLLVGLFLGIGSFNSVGAQQRECEPCNNPYDFIRTCADNQCTCTYTIAGWCDQNKCIDFSEPPPDALKKMPNFPGIGRKEQACSLSPKECVKPGVQARDGQGTCVAGAKTDSVALPESAVGGSSFDSIFGRVEPPQSLKALFGPGITPDQAITEVLSKVVELIYIVAGIIFVLYILWGAVEFIYSEGNKEQVTEARRRIIYAIIGIIILSVAFVVLRVLGQITGFKFFE